MELAAVSPRIFRGMSLACLVALVVVVVTGGAVRLTGSGLGCLDWPTCAGTTVVDASSIHSFIESANRVVTEIVGLVVLVTFGASLRRRPRRRDLVGLCAAIGVLFLANGIVGMIVVNVKLAPVSVVGHFLLSEAAIALAVVLVRRSRCPDAGADGQATTQPHSPPARVEGTARVLAWAVAAMAAWILVVGTLVTSAGPHAGDPEAKRLQLHMTDVTRVHSVSALLTVALLGVLLWAVRRDPAAKPLRTPGLLCLGVLLVQGALGYAQYFSGVPAILVGFHLLGATLTWISAVWLVLSITPPSPVGRHGRRVPSDTAATAGARQQVRGAGVDAPVPSARGHL